MQNKNKGFTLIELIVVMSVFLFVIGAAITIFLSIVQDQKRILSEQEILNQVSYTEEYMSKALRMAKPELNEACLQDDSLGANATDHPGYIYLLTRYDSSSDSDSGFFKGIKFINQSENDECQEFYLGNGDCSSANTTGPAVLCEIKGEGSKPVAITPVGLQINSVRFSVDGSNGSTDSSICQSDPDTGLQVCGVEFGETVPVQPRVTILLNVTIPGDNSTDNSTRTIQTTVSQRNLNAQ